MAAPNLTDEQRKAAMEKARKSRHDRSELLKSIKSGKVDPAGVLMRKDKDPIVERTKVLMFVKSWPGVGKVGASRILKDCGIDESRRIAGLGSRQRNALIKTWIAMGLK